MRLTVIVPLWKGSPHLASKRRSTHAGVRDKRIDLSALYLQQLSVAVLGAVVCASYNQCLQCRVFKRLR